MKKLILTSNHRLHIAILLVRIMGRNPATMSEVYDALNQRRNMRESCRFAEWLSRHEHQLRYRFDCWLGRHQFTLEAHGSERAAFHQFCVCEYQNN